MTEVVSLAKRDLNFRARASPKYSTALLKIDLSRNVFVLVFELLRDIYYDYLRLLWPDSSTRSGSHLDSASVGTQTDVDFADSLPRGPLDSLDARHLIVARLNVLVLVSKRVFLHLGGYEGLRQPLVESIYRVIRLVIWSNSRAIRCASLRCLRYYVRTALDIRLLLRLRMDLLIARCFDLSYLPDESNNSYLGGIIPPQLDARRSAGRRVTRFHARRPESRDSSPHALDNHRVSPLDDSRIPHTVRIHPRMRSAHVFQSGSERRHILDGVADPSVTKPVSPPGFLTSSTIVSSMGERKLFLRLAYNLLRVAPHLYPRSLVQAVAAPCLRANRFQYAGGSDLAARIREVPFHSPFQSALHSVRDFDLKPPRPIPTNRHSTRVLSENETNHITSDVALRACLLILAELVILAPEHVAHIEYALMNASDMVCSHRSALSIDRVPSDSVDWCARFQEGDSIVVQALMSTFASTPNLHTIHPVRIQEAVLFALLTLLNHVDTAQLVPRSRIEKFLVPFTSTTGSNMRPRTMFDSYPDFALCAKTCLTVMLRSWSGLFYFLNEGFPCLRTLMHSLAVGSSETKDQILDLLFGLFPTLPKPHPSTRDIDPAILGLLEALSSCAPSALPVIQTNASGERNPSSSGFQADNNISIAMGSSSSVLPRRRAAPSAWDIQGGFIAAEGLRVFPRPANRSCGLDLMDCYSALLLGTLIEAGVYEALIRAVSDTSQSTSARAGLMLGMLAYRASELLPSNHPAAKRLHHCGLLQARSSATQPAVLWIERVHRVMRAHSLRHLCPANVARVPIHSPFLECLARQSRAVISTSTMSGDILLSVSGSNESEAWIDQIIAQSRVLLKMSPSPSSISTRTVESLAASTEVLKPPDQWDWDLLTAFGRFLGESRSMISWDQKPRLQFLQRLMDFFTPTSTMDLKSLDCDAHVSDNSSFPTSKSQVILTGGDSPRSIKTAPSLLKGSITRGSRSVVTLCTAFGTQASIAPSTLAKTSNNLASLPSSWPHAPAAGILVAGLVPHLAIYPLTSEPGKLLTRFLSATRDAFERSLSVGITTADSKWGADPTALFTASQLAETCSGLLILAVGRLTSSDAGESRIEASAFGSTFHRLLLPTASAVLNEFENNAVDRERETLISQGKMLLSSLDFTRPGRLGHQLLTAAVTGATEKLRIYAIQLIRLLFRLQLPFLSSWCVELVVKLCLDSSRQVADHALHLLEELCWDSVNVHALARFVLPEAASKSAHGNHSSALTPFAVCLLHPQNGPIGHRVFASILSQSGHFKRFTDHFTSTSRKNSASLFSDPILSPVSWLLETAKRYFNTAYACEMDSRIWSIFTSSPVVATRSWWKRWLETNVCHSDPLFKQFLDRIPGLTNGDSELDPSSNSVESEQDVCGLRCNQRELFLFGEGDSFSETNASGFVLPPALVSDSDCIRTEDSGGNYWTCPLPRHPYGCLAEHADGMQMMVERGDLEALANILKRARTLWITRSRTSIPESTCATDVNSSVSLMETKGALWALAHVSSATFGHPWIAERPELIQYYAQFALDGVSMGLRAVAWLCLNLLTSKSDSGHLISQALLKFDHVRMGQGDCQSVWLTTGPQSATEEGILEPLESGSQIARPSNNPTTSELLSTEVEDITKTTTVFSVHSVPLLDGKLDGAAPLANPSSSVTEAGFSSRNMNGQRKLSAANQLGFWNPFRRVTLSTLSSRTRRWLPRRWSPYRHKNGSTSIDAARSGRTVYGAGPSHAISKHVYARHSSIDSSRQSMSSVVQEPDAVVRYDKEAYVAPASSSLLDSTELASVPRSCATWTHHDQQIYRATLSALPAASVLVSSAIRALENTIDIPKSLELSSYVPTSFRSICLPDNVRLLGQSPHRILQRTKFDDASSGNSSDGYVGTVSTPAHQMSFIRIANAAQLMLDKVEVTDPSIKTQTSVSIAAPGKTQLDSHLNVVSCKLCAQEPVDTNCHSGHENRPTDLDFNVNGIQQNECHSRIRPDESLHNIRSTSVPDCQRIAMECLSPMCRRQASSGKTSMDGQSNRSRWLSQVLDVLTGFLANMFSSSHELALCRLIETARVTQDRQSRNFTGKPESFLPSECVFDACAYTEVACLLQDYTFPLEARTKIQSAFLDLQLYDLLGDVKQALDTLEHVLKQRDFFSGHAS